RMKVNGMTHFDMSFYGILRGIILTLKSYIIWSRYLIILSIAAILILGYSLNKAIKFNFKNIIIFPNSKTKFILFLETYKWHLVAFSTILPFILALSLVSPRTSIFFMYFLIIFIVTFFYKIIFNTTNNINAINNINFLLVVLGLFLINLSVTITDYNSGKILKSTIVLREKKLKNARNKEVAIKLIDKNLLNHCYIFTDFQLHEINNTKWIRERQEEYFGIKKIIVIE
ncbi:hypothetical protein, partial [Flavobacterium sp.]|uniref:hypothetical protein n=1 Tax=Flavobacterium sp. TaxID=239 RepID=UPI00375018C6